MAVQATDQGHGSYELNVDKNKWESPKTNYLNVMFAEHQTILQAARETRELDERYFERLARLYGSNVRKSARKEIFGDILSIDPEERGGNLAKYKAAFMAQWALDHDGNLPEGDNEAECKILALIECVGDCYEETAKYYQIEGNELAMFIQSLWNWDSQGGMFVMTEDMDWAYDRVKEFFGTDPKNIFIEKIEVPADEQ